MTLEEKQRVMLTLISMRIIEALQQPNTEAARKTAVTMEKPTGISRLELQRFHNAILNNNLDRSFKPGRAGHIAWELCKVLFAKERICINSRAVIEKFAKDHGFPLNDVLESFRTMYHEIVDEGFKPDA